MKIAISHNAWHVCGGGELYVGALAEELAQVHDVSLVITTPFDRSRLRSLLGLTFKRVTTLCLAKSLPAPPTRIQRFAVEMSLQKATRAFDLVIRVATRTVPPPCGRRAWLHVQVPFVAAASDTLKSSMHDAWNTAATQGYAKVLFNSAFTAGFATMAPAHEQNAVVLPPPVNVTTSGQEPPWHLRPQNIISVGRFDGEGHCKRQLEMVQAFARMVQNGLRGWQLILAGAASARPSSRAYVVMLREQSRGLPVQVLTNVPRSELLALYESSRIYWHAAGLGVDERRRPELVEHFGISTVEAMARGCVPIVIDSGGQKEIVAHGVSGYRWKTLAELEDYTWTVIKKIDARNLLDAAAQASQAFSRARFGVQARALAAGL